MFIRILYPTLTRTPLGHAWAVIVDHLCAAIALHVHRLPAIAPRLAGACAHYLRILSRLDRLAQRWQDGTLPKPRPRSPHLDAGRKPPVRPRLRLPTGKAWLLRMVQPTALSAYRMEIELAKPETRALVEAAPQAGRLLRPLCHALGVAPPDWLRLPRKPRPKPEPKPRKPRLPPGYLPGMLLTDRPLPQRIIDAVRSHKKRGLWTPA